jgi:hypothetical protein
MMRLARQELERAGDEIRPDQHRRERHRFDWDADLRQSVPVRGYKIQRPSVRRRMDVYAVEIVPRQFSADCVPRPGERVRGC